jgi:hypothetical protein
VLKRPDKSVLTDIDAVVMDHETGDLALIQLKWYDIVGFSLQERESRRQNILDANQWVQRIDEWIANRCSKEVAAALDLNAGNRKPPLIFVIVRHELHFSANGVYDRKAAWIMWPNLVKTVTTQTDVDLCALYNAHRGGAVTAPQRRQQAATYELPDLTVEVRTRD